MKNKKGKSFLGMLLLLIAIGVFGYFGYSTMNQIKLGLDLAGGVSITYQAKEENPSSEDMCPHRLSGKFLSQFVPKAWKPGWLPG